MTRLLMDDGTVRTFGGDPNGYGVLGQPGLGAIGDEPGEMPPPEVDLGPGFVEAIATGGSETFTCALFDDDEVRCWGRNLDGSLGINNSNDIGDDNGEMPPPLAKVF